MKRITTGLSIGSLLFTFLTVADVMAKAVPYGVGNGRISKSGRAIAPAKKLPPHPVAPLTANFGAAGIGFPSGRYVFSFNYLFSQTDTLRFHGSEAGGNAELLKNLGVAKLRYGIAPGFDLRSETPLYLMLAENDNEDKTYYWMGDTTVVLHKIIISQSEKSPFSVALDLGATLPTAVVNDNSADFYGTGNWGMLVGVGATGLYGRHRLDGEVNFASFHEGRHNYRKPDRCRVNIGWGYVVTPQLDLGIESSYEWNGQSGRQGLNQLDSFTEWFIGPKAAYRLPEYNALIGTALTFPAYRYYDTLTPSDNYRFELKFSRFF